MCVAPPLSLNCCWIWVFGWRHVGEGSQKCGELWYGKEGGGGGGIEARHDRRKGRSPSKAGACLYCKGAARIMTRQGWAHAASARRYKEALQK
ncbi:hypothetical protein EV126DRAFT_6242 [Verticillium dahliae]|nr:hypothetical protein EV126DRAFT_6242 [Verticillium dahliae]